MDSKVIEEEPFSLKPINRPEIEDGLGGEVYLEYLDSLKYAETSVDVLEVYGSSPNDCQWQQHLIHQALRHHFGDDADADIDTAADLRIIFLNPVHLRGSNWTVAASSLTLEWLRARFGVSILFLDAIIRVTWGIKPGHACFTQRDRIGKLTRLDAIYHIFSDDLPCRVWFTYLAETHKRTYIIFNCPLEARNIMIKHGLRGEVQQLLRLGAVESTIVNAGDRDLKDKAMHFRGVLLDYEKSRTTDLLSDQYLETFQRLHNLSQGLHILLENMMDQREVIDFILSFHRKHIEHSSIPLHVLSANESLEYLLSRNTLWRRWVSSYNTRTKIRIDLAFNVASQNDNRINLHIANISAQIAQDTRKDSSSMITIAALTMLFLPGTFISASFLPPYFSLLLLTGTVGYL